jgi:hypothetical protein
VALDPIVSLAVGIAEGPGSYAFFLGSGVSRDAGVPTGSQVYWKAVGELYRLEHTTRKTPKQAALATWLADTGRGDAGYSDVLELIAPDPATRRDYLAKHFEGVAPGRAHKLIAGLAARGLVTVFITTNFDRLLERALQGQGLEPVVVTSDADLASAPPREHTDTYVLKPHGDYLQQTIRNTPAELAELEPGVRSALQEILDRYGVVVLGYSGSDEAVTQAFDTRRSRYGLYWLTRSKLAEPARTLVEKVGGRVINRSDAAEFLADLDTRLSVLEAHPSGLTPLMVHDEVLLLLRRSDSVGLSELLRRERREFADRLRSLMETGGGAAPTPEIALSIHKQLMPVLERRLSSMLPLLLHGEGILADEIGELADAKDREQLAGDGYVFWPELFDYAIWFLGYSIGAAAIREKRLSTMKPLLGARIHDRYRGEPRPLVQVFPGEAGSRIGAAVMAQIDNQQRIAPAWELLRRDLGELELLRQRYPELVSSEGEVLRNLACFDFVLSASMSLAGFGSAAHWTMYSGSIEQFVRQLRDDDRLRAPLADAMGIPLEGFQARVAEALRSVQKLGRFPDLRAIKILEEGLATG